MTRNIHYSSVAFASKLNISVLRFFTAKKKERQEILGNVFVSEKIPTPPKSVKRLLKKMRRRGGRGESREQIRKQQKLSHWEHSTNCFENHFFITIFFLPVRSLFYSNKFSFRCFFFFHFFLKADALVSVLIKNRDREHSTACFISDVSHHKVHSLAITSVAHFKVTLLVHWRDLRDND